MNNPRQIFEELLLTRWEYRYDPDFKINEKTGEYEDDLVIKGYCCEFCGDSDPDRNAKGQNVSIDFYW